MWFIDQLRPLASDHGVTFIGEGRLVMKMLWQWWEERQTVGAWRWEFLGPRSRPPHWLPPSLKCLWFSDWNFMPAMDTMVQPPKLFSPLSKHHAVQDAWSFLWSLWTCLEDESESFKSCPKINFLWEGDA